MLPHVKMLLYKMTYLALFLKSRPSVFLKVCTTHPVDLQVKIKITPSFSSVLRSRGDAEIRSRVNEIFLVALFEISTFLC